MNRKNRPASPTKSPGGEKMLKAAPVATAAGGAPSLTARTPPIYDFDSANATGVEAAFLNASFGKMAATLTAAEAIIQPHSQRAYVNSAL
jgi:hypothetical protein